MCICIDHQAKVANAISKNQKGDEELLEQCECKVMPIFDVQIYIDVHIYIHAA